MFDEHDLLALLEAYIDADTLARKALIDALDEAGDKRGEKIREEAIDWDALAIRMGGQRGTSYRRRQRPQGTSAYIRFQIDCVRFGSTTTAEVTNLVRAARRTYARKLFPDLGL